MVERRTRMSPWGVVRRTEFQPPLENIEVTLSLDDANMPRPTANRRPAVDVISELLNSLGPAAAVDLTQRLEATAAADVNRTRDLASTADAVLENLEAHQANGTPLTETTRQFMEGYQQSLRQYTPLTEEQEAQETQAAIKVGDAVCLEDGGFVPWNSRQGTPAGVVTEVRDNGTIVVMPFDTDTGPEELELQQSRERARMEQAVQQTPPPRDLRGAKLAKPNRARKIIRKKK